MKITRKAIKASTHSNSIPYPFDQYYEIISDEAIEDLTGYPARPAPSEEIEGYDTEHLAWVAAKPEYMDELSDSALGYLELIKDGNDIFLGYVIGSMYDDRLFTVGIDEVENAINTEGYFDEDYEENY